MTAKLPNRTSKRGRRQHRISKKCRRDAWIAQVKRDGLPCPCGETATYFDSPVGPSVGCLCGRRSGV